MKPAIVAVSLLAVITSGSSDTVVHENTYELTLPGGWQKQAASDALVYTHGDDTVYVTTLEPKDSPSRRELENLAHRIADMRRKLIGDLSRGQSTSTDLLSSSSSNGTIFHFRGEDPRNGKRFFVAVFALPRIVVTTALYRPLASSPDGFGDLANHLMASVHAVK